MAAVPAELHQRPFDVVWHPSQGLLRDLLQAALIDKLELVRETTRLLIDIIRGHLTSRAHSERLLPAAHSQGAGILNGALQQLQPPERARIDIVTYGGAGRGFPQDLHTQRHVVNILDPVPFELGVTKEWANDDGHHVLFVGTLHTMADYVEEEKRNRANRPRPRRQPRTQPAPFQRYSIQ
jgi:hypothetical protein